MNTAARLFFCLAAILALYAPREARCQLVATLDPEHPVDSEEVFVEVISPPGPQCFPPGAIISGNGNSLLVKLVVTDACVSDDYVTDRRYLVGAFPEGSYTLDVEYCALNPPPFPSGCSVIAHFSFDVAATGQGNRGLAVPVNSKRAATLLVLAILFVSAGRLTRADRHGTLSLASYRVGRAGRR